MLDFPMPNDKLTPLGEVTERTVIASTYYRDEPTVIALVLLLRPLAPFFEVAHYYLEAAPEEANAPARQQGELLVHDRIYNIVPAVRLYEENGGEY